MAPAFQYQSLGRKSHESDEEDFHRQYLSTSTLSQMTFDEKMNLNDKISKEHSKVEVWKRAKEVAINNIRYKRDNSRSQKRMVQQLKN